MSSFGTNRNETTESLIMNHTKAIKPGPKPKKQDGTPDERRRVNPETKPKHPDLKPHKHRPGEPK